MGEDEMVEQLDYSPEWTQKQRLIARQESLEQMAERLASALRGLKYALRDLQPFTLEDCEGWGAGSTEYDIGNDAFLVEIHSDDPEQIDKAKRIRDACREAIARQKQCIFVRDALPLIRQLTEGIELPPPRRPKPRAHDAQD